MIIIAFMLLSVFVVAVTSIPRAQFVDDSTHNFVGDPMGGPCQRCGKPYSSPVHHSQR